MLFGLPGRYAAARVITEVFQPPIVVAVMMVLSPAGSPGFPETIWYGVIAAVFTCVVPFLVLVALVRAGKVSDHHVSDRRQRGPVLALSLVVVLAGLGVLAFLKAPASVIAMVLALVGGIALLALVSLVWKISGHAAAITSAAVSLMFLFGPAWWPALLLVPVVMWSRIVLRAHTPAQLAAGAVFGGAVIVGLWRMLLAWLG
ncbi:phosphatase PAP2 family protein [Sinomonas sp. ASV322]|uniref:phosphatase PAP2 family protein n=1 Tax=Sinomonas sp. ASV322 TaxID=3041920 RepID=UPI0027DC4C51|nr:phosphatase PAP2 family protein [Sinomonas sp. ASV322]MDQ4503490.1 phosphatase PAP2 family protein [Sinomonas sp. ASV322]